MRSLRRRQVKRINGHWLHDSGDNYLDAHRDRAGLVGNEGDASRSRQIEAILQDGFDLEQHESRLLELAVQRAGGNLTHAAKLLGITRRQLAYRLKLGGGLREVTRD
jgi:transcriptional regulator with AAA-type ATPase domain